MNREIDKMILDLMEEKELKTKDHEERIKICEEIRREFIKAGHNCCLVYPYGSTINSVGFHDSDLDLYVDLETEGDTQTISKVLENSEDFIKIEAVPNARVPIVKAIHFPSGVKCDISFGHKASLWNTEFIRYI